MQEFFNVCKSNNEIHHINKWKGENNMIISADAKKAFNKTQHLFVIKKKKKTPENQHRMKLPQYNKVHIQQSHREHYSQQ